MRQLLAGLIGVAATAASVEAATFYNVANVDLSPATLSGNVGTNISAVAWNGTDLFVAGLNNSAAVANTGIVKVSSARTAPVIGTPFGVTSTPAGSRGYMGLDVAATPDATNVAGPIDLAATFDSGTATTSRFDMYNGDNSLRWTFAPAVRPPTGPAFDLTVSRVSYLYQGSHLIRNYAVDVTAASNTGNPPSEFNNLGLGTAFRDLDFNPTTGDAWARLNNDVVKAPRTGPGSYGATPLLAADLANANSVGTNVQFLNFTGGDSVIIYNNRASNATGQAFTSVIGGVNDDGSPETLTFLNDTGTAAFAPATGSSVYDFSWDSATQTLAVADSLNNRVYIFATTPVPEPTALAVAVVLVPLLGRRRRR